jgi:hypothetical protein
MPNTFVSRSRATAFCVWVMKRVTNFGSVDFVSAGNRTRRYYVTWA